MATVPGAPGDQDVSIRITTEYDDTGTSAAMVSLQHLQVSVSSITASMMGMFNMQFMQMRAAEMQAVSLNNLENAQMGYNNAVAKFGKDSEQAIAAHNRLENAQSHVVRTQLMLERYQRMYVLQTIPMMFTGIMGLVQAYQSLLIAQGAAGNIAAIAGFIASTAQIGVAAYTLSQAAEMAATPGTAPTMHRGGEVPRTGKYYLEAGEKVTSTDQSQRGGGGGTTPIVIQLQVDGRQIAQAVYPHVEYERRRGSGVGQ